MKNNISKNIILTVGIASSMLMTSCVDFWKDGFLDQVPDNRTELKTASQIAELLVYAYPETNFATIAELSSDNFIDNNTPDDKGVYYHLSSYDRANDEAFAWKDIVSATQQDSPSHIWEGCYYAIAVANHALEAIYRFESEGKGDEVKAHKGEALMARAYSHFVLANMFCQAYKGEEASKADLGIPYVTEPETTVHVGYKRGSVADVYKLIENDIEEALPLINDELYDVPKYHFNKRAANAFAARFYLYKRDYEKVVACATEAITENPTQYLRDWSKSYSTISAEGYGWIDASSMNNLLLIPTSSVYNRIYGYRYGHNRDAANGTIYGVGPTWSGNYHPCYDGRLYVSRSQDYGLILQNTAEMFEYTDKVAGIGFPHVVRMEFTGDETLLCRAEAYVHLGNLEKAYQDLKYWDEARKNTPRFTPSSDVFKPLTHELIKSFYSGANPLFYFELNTTEMGFPTVEAEKIPYLQCVLHFRRHETIFTGLRWFDIKRYGIEVTHKIGKPQVVDVLKWNDPRRALQLPAEVIAAGIEPNDRLVTPNNDAIVKLPSIYVPNDELR